MSDAPTTALDPESDEAQLVAAVPTDGSNTTNPKLKANLGWDSDRYYAARDRLLDLGLVQLARGRGGVVHRTPPTQEAVPAQDVDQEAEAIIVETALAKERELYPPMREVVAGEWAKDHRFHPLAVEITAQQGRRDTGGRFTRPDLVAIEVRSYRYVPGKVLEVVTFEVKPSWALDVTCVYEALAHRQSATRSYVLLHVPDPEPRQADLDAIEEAARTHGIGMIIAESPNDYGSWDTRHEAVRHEPDPARLDDFIHTQLSETTRDRVRTLR